MTFPAQVPERTGTWQSHYFQKIAELDTETARVAAAPVRVRPQRHPRRPHRRGETRLPAGPGRRPPRR